MNAGGGCQFGSFSHICVNNSSILYLKESAKAQKTKSRANAKASTRLGNFSPLLVKVRRFTIEKVIKLVDGVLRGVLIPAWLRLRVLFPLFLFY